MSGAQADLDIGIGGSTDPFATGAKGRGKIHVRIQQRNGRCVPIILSDFSSSWTLTSFSLPPLLIICV